MSRRTQRRLGELLSYWRDLRGFSQIELAMLAGTSTRNLSFIENNRAVPNKALLEQICESLGIASRDRDLVLRSGGHGPSYGSIDLSEPEMSWLGRVLASTVRKLDPFPAVVMDRETTIVTSNPSAIRILHWLAHDTKLYQSGVRNLSELSLSKDGLRPFLANWEEVARCILDRMYREIAIEDTDGSMLEVSEKLFSIEGVPKEWRMPPTEASDPLMRFCYQKNGHEISLDSLVTTVGTPADLNYQKIRMRYFIPADEPSHEFLIDLAATGDDLDALIRF